MGIIYLARNIVNDNVYIGITTRPLEKRVIQHYSDARNNKYNAPLHNAIRKYGTQAFTWKVLETVDNKYLPYVEQVYITYYRLMGYKLYNATEGGDGTIGYKHTDEAKAKMSKARKGTNYGGRKHTPETRAKMVETRGKPVVMKAPDGQIVEILNMRDFCRKNNINRAGMVKVITGKQSNHKGWTKA